VFPENFVAASGVLVRRDVVIQAGLFTERTFGEDAELWARVLRFGTAVVLPEPGYWYTQHAGQITVDKRALHKAKLELWREFGSEDPVTRAATRRLAGVVLWDELADLSSLRRLRRWLRESRRRNVPIDALPRLLAWRYGQRARLEAALAFAEADES
jgi:hypothetical protein